MLVLALIWGAAFNLIKVERDAAESRALTLTAELGETYESQVLRSLREIKQHLQLMQYSVEQNGQTDALQVMKERRLLPPALLFNVALLDEKGAPVDSRGDYQPIVADEQYLSIHQPRNTFNIASPIHDPLSGQWKLQFSRGLHFLDRSFAGVAVIEVDAAFFVSSYEPSKLGQAGSLGMIGTDGQFRARRVGDNITVGQTIDYRKVRALMGPLKRKAVLAQSPIDGLERYISMHELFEFPLAVTVSLSRDEQLLAVAQKARVYRWRAAAGSVAMILLMSVLWRMSIKLAESQRRELTTRITHAEQIEHMAYHDSLTGLPNRSLYSKLLEQSIKQVQRDNSSLAVLFLDIDHFKFVNDTLGHNVGDFLLQEVSRRIQRCLRDSDIVARLGGDEFVVILPVLTDPKYTYQVARKINAAIAQPYFHDEQEFRVTTSIGVAVYPDSGLDEQTLTKHADIAMYKVKEEGKNGFHIYSDALHSESLERLTLESSLQHALERNELAVFYQAKRSVANGDVTGVEALLRWHHPDLGVIAPLRFLQVAEDIGQLIPIGRWVLRTVCEQNVRWQQQGLPRLTVAVNLTAVQFFYPGLLADIETVLAQSGMEAELLEIEVCENVLLQDAEKAVLVLGQLKQLGVRIAIDNFGVGYSSLSMLKQFPLDAIKIDRTFIRDLVGPASDMSLAEAIFSMGRALGMTVVAQGVETEEQVSFLKRNACDEAQGYYFNCPVSPDDFSTLLKGLPKPSIVEQH